MTVVATAVIVKLTADRAFGGLWAFRRFFAAAQPDLSNWKCMLALSPKPLNPITLNPKPLNPIALNPKPLNP